MAESKPGIHTTEFWLTAATNVLGGIVAFTNVLHVSDTRILTLLALVNAAYAVARGLAKLGVPADLAVDLTDVPVDPKA